MVMRARQWLGFASLSATVVLLVSVAAQPLDRLGAVRSAAEGQDQGQVREFTIIGNNYAFSPASIQVNKNDLIKITFTAQDIPHSFTIEEYRIVKRASAGQTVTLEFQADQAGRLTPFRNPTQDPKA